MDDLNQVLIEGRLTRDPVCSTLTADCPLCSFAVANNRYFKTKNKPEGTHDTSYFLVECWGKLAESCLKYLSKGQGVRVAGKLKQFTWKSKPNDGRPKERVYIIAQHIEFQPKKSNHTEQISQEEVDSSKSSEIQESLDQYASNPAEEIETNTDIEALDSEI